MEAMVRCVVIKSMGTERGYGKKDSKSEEEKRKKGAPGGEKGWDGKTDKEKGYENETARAWQRGTRGVSGV